MGSDTRSVNETRPLFGPGQLTDHAPIVEPRSAPAYRSELVELYEVDCFDWLRDREPNSIHAIVTDPPYGFLEYQESHLTKMKNGRGEVWRIPPKLDGYTRAPLPRFTVQTPDDLALMSRFFREWARLAHAVLVPGGHIFIATNPLLSSRLLPPYRRPDSSSEANSSGWSPRSEAATAPRARNGNSAT